MSAESDERGRALVAVGRNDPDVTKSWQGVYDTTGRLFWRKPGHFALYAGGYVMETQAYGDPSDPKSRIIIHKPSGPVVASWSNGGSPNEPPSADVESLQPGLLVATRLNESSDTDEIVLLDVAHPGKAREKVMRPPFTPKPYGPHPQVQVTGEHVYVSWSHTSLKRIPIARYDPPSATPVWHRRAPARQASTDPYDLFTYPDPSGGADIVGFRADDRTWFLRPDTGTVISRIGRSTSYTDNIFGASGGRAYIDGPNSTKIVNPHTGAVVRTINAHFVGITTNGYLIARSPNTISAYRWK